MEIEGQGFTLRGWKESDVTALQRNADNPNVSAFLLDKFPNPYTTDDAIWWVNLMSKQDPFLNFVIGIDGELAGGIGIELRADVYRKCALIGYWLGESYWGRGIMPQAVKLVADYTFANFDIHRLQAGIFGNNTRSMRVLEKAGFVKEGILKNAVIKNGVVLDEHVYGLSRN
ncbi:GNAT family N-acetyltransferase [Mucilaginibacter sp. L3T2-6]|uniref:GNAT family N-acetyltransferase n=1 Tax=Mucilaginibacter sp. L3T2-6 TaxID=3062491 RepID=UPI002676C483|nr:GNAT family protein [Mucilaginibacter sp. L3T2-6]MDO3645066.1 GNAT family protein [Mucilaginibacter sp. L3T2-6]MDV6217517.1 GNAT family protein [Mucilaginibacter sp. L3T2-6]